MSILNSKFLEPKSGNISETIIFYYDYLIDCSLLFVAIQEFLDELSSMSLFFSVMNNFGLYNFNIFLHILSYFIYFKLLYIF